MCFPNVLTRQLPVTTESVLTWLSKEGNWVRRPGPAGLWSSTLFWTAGDGGGMLGLGNSLEEAVSEAIRAV
jgi:hypothetical protein